MFICSFTPASLLFRTLYYVNFDALSSEFDIRLNGAGLVDHDNPHISCTGISIHACINSTEGEMIYTKHYTPLEAKPVLFTQLIHRLGVSQDLKFQDVFSIDDLDLLRLNWRSILRLLRRNCRGTVLRRNKADEQEVLGFALICFFWNKQAHNL